MRRSTLIAFVLSLLAAPAAQAEVNGSGTLVKDIVEGEIPKERFALQSGTSVIHVTETPGMAEAVGSQVIVRDGKVVAAAPPPVPPAAQTFRTLVLPVTAPGASTPWTPAEIAAAFRGDATSLDGFLQAQTRGAWRVEPTVAPWLTASGDRCGASISDAVATARSAGLNVTGYDRIVVVAGGSCPGVTGQALLGGDYLWLYGTLDPRIVAHEFGHTLGLDHANLLGCQIPGDRPSTLLSACSPREYGDIHDTMGAPFDLTLLSTYNRWKLGTLLGRQQLVRESTTVTLDTASADGTTLLRIPRKRVGTRVTEFLALELRDHRSVWDASVPDDGVLVRVVPQLSSAAGQLLVDVHPDSYTGSDAALRVGETFADPEYEIGLELLSLANGQATLEITTPGHPDDVAPDAPRLVAEAAPDGAALRWPAVEDDDSGTVEYRLERDGAPLATLPGERLSYVDRVAGRHSYALRAVDAAGNAGAPGTDRTWWLDPKPVVTPPAEPPAPAPSPAPSPAPVAARDTRKPTFTLSPKVGKRPVRLPGRTLKITARDDRPGVRVAVMVSGRNTSLRKGALRLSVKQAKRSTVTITVTDVAGNRATTTLRVRSARATLTR